MDLVKESDDLQICPGEKAAIGSDERSIQGTPQTPKVLNAGASNSTTNIRIVSTISSTPTISFSFIQQAANASSKSAPTTNASNQGTNNNNIYE